MIQPKLMINQPGDIYEQEADRMAERVMRMPDPILQRRCANCDEDQKKFLQAKESQGRLTINKSQEVPSIVHEVLRSPGQPLDSTTRAYMEPRFGHDFSKVKVHTDTKAARSAQDVNALAYTVGLNVVFGSGQYAPRTTQGKRLIAHELTHIAQQNGSNTSKRIGVGSNIPLSQYHSPDTALQRTPDEKATESSGELRATSFTNITMHFDGKDLIVSGDNKEVFRFSAQSGKPIRITEEDAKQCGADVTTDTYMNDKRFVGIKDKGPIPEGTYTFSAPLIERFTLGEQLRLGVGKLVGKSRVTVHRKPILAGDWGRGRVQLRPRGHLREGPCGDVKVRNDFFLHGGILSGSSGCIDIDGDFSRLADFLAGYRRTISVTVSYEKTPPSVGFFTGLSGAIAYGEFGLGHGPSLRLGAEFGPTGTRALAAVSYDAILQWAGGAIAAGVRLDVPFNDSDAFIRAGLSGGADFRIFRPLYGRLFGGYSWDLTGSQRTSGPELGAGLRLDLNRIQLEALHNVLRPAADDQRVHQALIKLGFQF
ncbi:MAG TPA: DUF4157 domain-containing protein [Syntrophorhabdaceae bacterium]|nr:DUF4157 domain-containing protein [Syntrophorhabdaceae bacterium]